MCFFLLRANLCFPKHRLTEDETERSATETERDGTGRRREAAEVADRISGDEAADEPEVGVVWCFVSALFEN